MRVFTQYRIQNVATPHKIFQPPAQRVCQGQTRPDDHGEEDRFYCATAMWFLCSCLKFVGNRDCVASLLGLDYAIATWLQVSLGWTTRLRRGSAGPIQWLPKLKTKLEKQVYVVMSCEGALSWVMGIIVIVSMVSIFPVLHGQGATGWVSTWFAGKPRLNMVDCQSVRNIMCIACVSDNSSPPNKILRIIGIYTWICWRWCLIFSMGNPLLGESIGIFFIFLVVP